MPFHLYWPFKNLLIFNGFFWGGEGEGLVLSAIYVVRMPVSVLLVRLINLKIRPNLILVSIHKNVLCHYK